MQAAQPQPEQWSFAIDGDLHYDVLADPSKAFTTRKPSSVLKLKAAKPHFVIVPGDMIEHGADGSKPWYKGCSRAKVADELSVFQSDYMGQVEAAGIKCYCCLGNHDYSRNYPDMNVLSFIRDHYGATYNKGDPDSSGCYSFDYCGVRFAVLGVFPKDIVWTKALLARTSATMPLIFVWHYNTDPSQPWSDWWSQAQRATFFDLIQDRVDAGKVLCIFNGHMHGSTSSIFRGVNVVVASGNDKLCIVRMSGTNVQSITHL